MTHTDYEQTLINFIKKNKNRQSNKPLFHVNTTKVSASGMTRHMNVYVMRKGVLCNITSLVSDVTGWTQTHDGVKVGGCGMDMTFHLVDRFMSSIGIENPCRTRVINNIYNL